MTLIPPHDDPRRSRRIQRLPPTPIDPIPKHAANTANAQHESSEETQTGASTTIESVEARMDPTLRVEEEEIGNKAVIVVDDNDCPVQQFSELIQSTKAEHWKIRTDAFAELVLLIPASAVEKSAIPNESTNHNSNTGIEQLEQVLWYTSPSKLEMMGAPISQLLKDPRSSVVRLTCSSLHALFEKCHILSNTLLLNHHILPSVLDVHGLSSKLMHTLVQRMMTFVLTIVPLSPECLRMLLTRLRRDKSPTVRTACALYLGMAIRLFNDTNKEVPHEKLLTDIAVAFVEAMRDPNVDVRREAKIGLDKSGIRTCDNVWESIINDPNGPAAKDPKLLKVLQSPVAPQTL